MPVTPDEAEALRRVIALQFAIETPTDLAVPHTFEILRAAMNEWAPVYDALDALPAGRGVCRRHVPNRIHGGRGYRRRGRAGDRCARFGA